MFFLNNWKVISNAAQTADRLKPAVKIEAPGMYRVAGRKGSEFLVYCYKDGNKRVVDCSCVAGQKLNTPCFHSAAAVKAHVTIVTWDKAPF